MNFRLEREAARDAKHKMRIETIWRGYTDGVGGYMISYVQ